MILAALLLGLQAAPPAFMADPAFNAAYGAWARCTNGAVDAAAGSNRREREIVAAAHAACTSEEAGVRAAMIAVMGERRGPRMMEELVRADRNALAGRLRERRAGSGGVDALIQAWVRCLLRGVEAAPAEAPEAPAVEAAFSACAAEEEAMRRLALTLGSAGQADEFIRRARATNREHLLSHLRERRAQANPPR